MLFDFETCYAAVKNRDARYDGVFFTGVSSTGIFCRPVCPAVTPKPENCEFYLSSVAAMAAGYRPCLRCRPESAPNSPAWNGVKTTVKRALTLIDQGALDNHTVSELAERLGISDRYLRRLFSKHVGASPRDVARSRRVLLAKRLISDSADSMTPFINYMAHLPASCVMSIPARPIPEGPFPKAHSNKTIHSIQLQT
ncbi:bifunctional transcriptional activator/DNA repair enzyme AdaA [Candidatus Spongiihabitans sp.]|uniref:bifunctional transcriptional activator/DNA repair enzyme AdaA n=1 Tax=Candidatus Spongiihabitans sp. TaxID=3101308 RepID=UPI003C6F1729